MTWRILFAALILLRLLLTRNLRVGSDEFQHLHVVWGWSRGLLQYRDVFDNHTPLFQMLSAPLFAMLGERADILIPMRFLILAFYVWSLVSTYFIGLRLFNKRTAAWAVLGVGVWLPFLHTTTEYRTDGPWAACWLATMLMLVGRPLSIRRAFCGGLLLGITFAMSMKTVLLAAALVLAAVVIWTLVRQNDHSFHWKWALTRAAAIGAGAIVIPAIVAGFFIAKGAWGPFYYCVFQHNIVPGLGHWQGNGIAAIGPRQLAFPLVFAVLVWLAIRIFRQPSADPETRSRQMFVLLMAGFYCGALYSYWPLVTRQDWAPVEPLSALIITPIILYVCDFLSRKIPRLSLVSNLAPACLVLAGFVWVINRDDPARFNPESRIDTLAAVLKLTQPDEYVMDAKGEMIFRQRAFYYALEGVTHARMKLGLIRDDIIARLIATHTAVASMSRLPDDARNFVAANYLDLTSVRGIRVLGQRLASSPQPGIYDFDVAIPADYAILSRNKPVPGSIDGKPLNSSQFMEAGHHQFVAQQPRTQRVFLFWKRAADAGFYPEVDGRENTTDSSAKAVDIVSFNPS